LHLPELPAVSKSGTAPEPLSPVLPFPVAVPSGVTNSSKTAPAWKKPEGAGSRAQR
jgi:hypothetical protein